MSRGCLTTICGNNQSLLLESKFYTVPSTSRELIHSLIPVIRIKESTLNVIF
uniref:Uncharacterized protein n=1 Tax=Rhizophagus irregularis (strain DAOM 181602 / DAOM 197198 / MUCL 43194) TaxID=747089 RepID=U9ULU3_RHIID